MDKHASWNEIPLHEAPLTPLTTDTPATVGLRMLIRARADLVKARVMAHNQLHAHMLTAFPGVVGLFHQLDGKISLAFLQRFPTPRRARWLSEKRLAAWLHAAHYTRPTTRTPAQLFDHLCQAPAGLPDGPAADAAETITLERNLGEPCFLVPRRRRGPVCVNKL